MEATCWILDVYIDRQEAAIWVRTEDKRVLKLRDKYVPSLYILPSSKDEAERIVSGLRSEPEVESIGWVQKYINLDDEKKTDLLQVRLTLSKCKQLLRVLQKMERPPQVFNGDLLHVQLYLFTKLKIEPSSKVHFTFNPSTNRLLSIQKLDDDQDMAPPPFTVLTIQIFTESSTLTPDAVTDPIKAIAVRYCDEPEVRLLPGTEQEVLEALASVIREKDPDVVVAPSCDEFTFPYLSLGRSSSV